MPSTGSLEITLRVISINKLFLRTLHICILFLSHILKINNNNSAHKLATAIIVRTFYQKKKLH